MKIQNKDIYYGIALTQIAEYPTFTSINKITGKDGLFLINDNKRILIKYSTSEDGNWRFTIRKDDFNTDGYELYFVLVCGYQTVCVLTQEEISEILDNDSDNTQWIKVDYPDRGQMRVSGSLGELSHVVYHNAFPKIIFDDGERKEEFLWPPFSRMNIYHNEPNLIYSSTERALDLADNLACHVDEEYSPTVFFGLSTCSPLWPTWDESTLKKIEARIKYQFEYDGYDVDIERFTEDIDIPGRQEFLWRLYISIGLDDEEEDIDSNTVEASLEIQIANSNFPNLTFPKREPICPIEIDIDYLTQEEKYQYGGWGRLINEITAKWVMDNSYQGIGTIWSLLSPSANFHHQSCSEFYVIAGMPSQFRDYLAREIQVLGKYVRPYSDYITPIRADGWEEVCHIEKSKVWTMLDAVTWQEVRAS